jgi:hypothetical protein
MDAAESDKVLVVGFLNLLGILFVMYIIVAICGLCTNCNLIKRYEAKVDELAAFSRKKSSDSIIKRKET